MKDCSTDYSLCCIFIDDIIVFGNTFEEHLENLRLVFQRMREAKLKLSPSKCEFFKKKVKYMYVGHVVSEEGLEVD